MTSLTAREKVRRSEAELERLRLLATPALPANPVTNPGVIEDGGDGAIRIVPGRKR